MTTRRAEDLWTRFDSRGFRSGFFALILCSLAALSYHPLGWVLRMWVFLMGVALPSGLSLFAAWRHSGGAEEETSPLPVLDRRGWWVFLLVAFALRLDGWDRFMDWPGIDEVVHGTLSLQLMDHWDWSLFRYVSQMPPLYFWMQAGLYQAFGVSLSNLWLLSTCVSLATALGVFLWVLPRRTPSWVGWSAVFMGISFWPVYLGHFAHPAVLVPFWTVVGMAILGRWYQSPERGDKGIFFLGAWVGTGFYTYLAWPAVALSFLWGVWVGASQGRRLRSSLVFGSGVALTMVPWVVEAIQKGYGSYYRFLFSNGGSHREVVDILRDTAGYLEVLGWRGGGNYHPVWGGLFNPVLGALALVGIVEAFRARRAPWARCLLGALILSMVPAFVSVSVNPLRLVSVIPWFFLAAGWGLSSLLRGWPRGWAKWVLAGLLAVSFLLDAQHLSKARAFWSGSPQTWTTMVKQRSSYLGYQVLRSQAGREGPGYILTGFQLDFVDRSLPLACREFNLAEGASSSKVGTWAAFLCDLHYRPFLEKRFPTARFTDLEDPASPGRHPMLVVMEVPPEGMGPWLAAQAVFEEAQRVFFRRWEGGSYDGVMRALREGSDHWSLDPFLRSIGWEKVNLLYELDSAYGLKERRKDFAGSLEALSSALGGYPAAHLWNELGGLREIAGDRAGAIVCYKNAVASSLDRTPARENLRRLEGK